MRSILVAYAATAVAFLAIDAVWLSLMVNGFYRPRLEGLLLEKPNLAAAVPFYALYVAGVVFFAIAPALENGNIAKAFWMGAALGLLAYGTYDLTNLATLKGWSVAVTLADMVWGAALTGFAAAVGTWAAYRFV
jgi:uncharacterized membrane protein